MNELKILSVILHEDMYGLQIVESVKEYGANIFLGSLYNILARLEKKGFVENYFGEETAERGGNKRKYFKITGKGRIAVDEAQKSLISIWNLKLA